MSGGRRLPWLPYALLAGVLALPPLLLEGTYYKYLLVIVFIYSIVAVGLNILAGFAGQFSLGHAALMAMGAYATALFSRGLADVPLFAATGLHVWLGVALGTLVGGLAGAALAYPALRVRGPYLAMVTIAFGWVVWKILQEWTSVTGGDLGIASIPKAQIGAVQLSTSQYYYVVLGVFMLALAMQHLLVHSPFGLWMRAMKHSEIAVASVGIDVYRLKVTVFVISAAFAGCGGTLFAHQQNYISPDNFQFFSSVFFLLAILFGGAGTAFGPIVGAAVLTVLPELLQDFDKYRLIVYGCFILVTLYVLPRGVMGLFEGRARVAQTGAESARAKPSAGPAPVVAGTGCAIELQALSRAFGGLRAVSDVTLAIAPGTIHGLIGPNGAGKTTLINLMTGFYRPDAGRILVDGKPVAFRSLDAAARAGVARTFQTIKLFGDMTVREHVMVGFARHSRSGLWHFVTGSPRARREAAENLAQADAIIDYVGLGAFRDRPASALAYGHRRLLEIGRALASRPRFLLLDEPAAGLVQEEIDALAALIVALKNSGITILLVEHHIDLVVKVSDRVTVLDYGLVIADGPPAEIQRNEKVITAYLGTADAEHA